MRLSILGWRVRVDCDDPELEPYVKCLYAGLGEAQGRDGDHIRLVRSRRKGHWQGVSLSGQAAEWARASDALAWLDDELTVGVQTRRPDLLFLHAAAITRGERVALLVAESGGGKSTTTWAALHHGFSLLSDELAPVEPASLLVHPYLRSICLKSRPPRGYPLPAGALHGGGAHMIPTRLLPTAPAGPLAMIAFVSYQPKDPQPSLRPISVAESAARLYAQSLNPLAHRADGLEAVLRVASRARSFVLRSGDLPRTCALLTDALGG